jgi:dihydrofolate reductase
MKHFKAIAAMSENRVIGRENRIPWHVPEDFRWFKRKTIGQILVMGRKTFESIGRPLPGRETIVLSRSGFAYPGVRTVTGLEFLRPGEDEREMYVCGGAEVYARALPLCSDLYLTVVRRRVEGDAWFPAFEERFELVERLVDAEEYSVSHSRNRWMREKPVEW